MQQTRDQIVSALIQSGACGLLPLDGTADCPKRSGPDHPDEQRPGKVGFLTCNGCAHARGFWGERRVCTHPQAHQVAAAWLNQALDAWQRPLRRAPDLGMALARFGAVIGPDEMAGMYRQTHTRNPTRKPEGDDTMNKNAFDYVPQEAQAGIPRLYATEDAPAAALVWLKFFTPWTGWTWYATEFDGEDVFFGLVVGHETELGYFSLSELREVRGPLGLRIERDVWWKPVPLCEVAECPEWIKAMVRTTTDEPPCPPPPAGDDAQREAAQLTLF